MTKKQPLRVIIVGAGLGGLSAGIATALAGHHVTILEAAKELSEIGAGLQITPNGSKVLMRDFGLEAELNAVAAEPTLLAVHRYSDGKILAEETAFDINIRRKYGSPFIDIHRGDLQRILFNKAVSLGVDVQLGSRVSHVSHVTGKPVVAFQSGSKQDCDLVVGADGLWSKCRESLIGCSDRPLPTGDLAYRIVLDLEQINDTELRRLVTNPEVHFWIGPYSHAVGYSVRSGTMYNIVLLCPDDMPGESSRSHASVEEMRKLFVNWDPLLTRLLEHVQHVEKWKLMHREELQSWTNAEKDFLLIGDSCHPMLPYLAQGANSSIEDGAVLGRLLSHVKSLEQLPRAVSLFTQVRKSRSEGIVRETFAQREAFHMPDGEDQIKRDVVFTSQLGKKIEGHFPSRWTCPRAQPWLYGYDSIAEADQAVLNNPFIQKNDSAGFWGIFVSTLRRLLACYKSRHTVDCVG